MSLYNIYSMYNVYLISSEINDIKLYKIGFTRRLVEDRINDFKTGNVSNFEIISSYKSMYGTKIERLIQKHFLKNKIGGEWFSLCQDEVDDFIPLCEKYHNNYEILKTNTYLIDKNKI